MQLQLVHSRSSAVCVYASPSSLPVCVLQDDPLKTKMQGFLLSSTSQQEVATLDQKVCVRGAGQRVLGANSVQCVIATFHVSLSLMCMQTGTDSTALWLEALYWVCTVHVVCTSDLAQILETVEQINTIKLQREFYLGFAQNPQKFINEWLASQSRDLKVRSVHACAPVLWPLCMCVDPFWVSTCSCPR